MSDISIRFVLSAPQPDLDGFIYCKDVSRISTSKEGRAFLRGPLAALSGGYVFVIDGQVWNSFDRQSFNSEHARIPTDTLVFSAMLLEDLGRQLGERPTISCTLTELSILDLEFRAVNEVALTGVHVEGQVIFPPKVVLFSQLLLELISATDAFVQFAQAVLDRESADGQPAGALEVRRADLEFLERLRGGAVLLMKVG